MTIRNYISVILFLLAQATLSAQKDTTYQTIRQETGEYIVPVIETPADRLFRTKVPASVMFKINLAKYLFSLENTGSLDGRPIEIGVECKLSSAFSVGAYSGISSGFRVPNLFSRGRIPFFSTIGIEGRWYHDMEKRIKEGRGAKNFSGKYFGLEAIIFDEVYENKRWATQQVSLRYGLQQRFTGKGYFDISVGAGVTTRSLLSAGQPTFSFDQRLFAGLAAFLPKTRSSASDNNLCDVLHCQDEQYKMLKINIFNALVLRSNDRFFNFAVQPKIAYELKIGKSPFAVEAEAGAAYQKIKYGFIYPGQDQPNITSIRSMSWNATAELRYYYTMRKRILNGISGNNLSGAFFGLQVNRNQFIPKLAKITNEGEINFLDQYVLSGEYWSGNLVWGYQQRLFNHGFIQVKFGAGSTFGGHNYRYEAQNESFTKVTRNNELNLLSEIRVGFAF